MTRILKTTHEDNVRCYKCNREFKEGDTVYSVGYRTSSKRIYCDKCYKLLYIESDNDNNDKWIYEKEKDVWRLEED